ncbi:MAG: DUF1838 family protein [Woeseiaceae bacterium]
MNRLFVLLISVYFLSACVTNDTYPPTPPVASAEDNDVLRAWVDARAGTGEPVHWIAEGGIYEYPSGKKLFGMIGFDSSTVIWPTDPADDVVHLTRKTFAYTDPDTGEILKTFNGEPVADIAYPYQMITYRFENGRIYGDVEQGVAPRIQNIKSEDGMSVRMLGDTMAVTAAVFLDFPLPSGIRYEAWENYDFFIHPEGTVNERHQMSWQRYGALPAWAGGGKAIYHLLSWRVESQADFPANILAWAKAERPQWLVPPRDIAEVRALQSGQGGTGWAR